MGSVQVTRRRRPARRQRGLALLVMIIILLTLVMLGVAYLQATTIMRMAANVYDATDYAKLQIEAAVLEIAEVLRQDIVDGSGNAFSPGSNDEPYDYPWTNPASAPTQIIDILQPNPSPPPNFVVLGDAYFGENDDAWLASTAPVFDSTGRARWQHITNFRGLYITLPAGAGTPRQDVVDFSDPSNPRDHTDTFLLADPSQNAGLYYQQAGYEKNGVDTDGDGHLDARLTWAPKPTIGGTAYVMGLRIIDLSSMLNMNVVSQATSDGTASFYSNGPRGLLPTNIDASRLMSRVIDPGVVPALPSWTTQLENVLVARGFGTPVNGALGIAGFNPVTFSANTQADYWFTQASRYGTPTYSVTDEIDLRRAGGVLKDTGDKPMQTAMPTGLWGYDHTFPIHGDEYSAVSFDDMDGGGSADLDKYYQGGVTGTTIASRTFPTIRHMVTTMNGSSTLSPNHAGVFDGNTSPLVHKYDLAWEDYDHVAGVYDEAVRISNLFTRLRRAFLFSDSPDTDPIPAPTPPASPPYTNAYLGLDAYTDHATIEEIAAEFAMNIHDYSDADSIGSSFWLDKNGDTIRDAGETYFSVEGKPFLRGVYIQSAYQEDDLVDSGGAAFPVKDDYDTWVADAGSQALAIEVGNPFDKPIPGAAMHELIQVAIVQSGTVVSSYPLISPPDLPARPAGATPTGSECLVIYQNSTSTITEGGVTRNDLSTADGIDLAGQVTNAAITTLALPAGTLSFNYDEDITVELRWLADDPDATFNTGDEVWVTYDTMTVAGFQLAQNIVHGEANPVSFQNAVPTAGRHAQASMVRDGRFLRWLSNTGLTLTTRTPEAPVAGVDDYRNRAAANHIDMMGDDDKGAVGDTALDTLQIRFADRQFFSAAELAWVFMIGFHDGVGGDFPTRLASMIASTPKRLFLDIDRATAAVPASTNLQHAGVLMDLFAAMTTRFDNIDNDDDGLVDAAADPDEQRMPGVMNINTVPYHLGVLAAPLGESMSEIEDLYEMVYTYRDASPWIDGFAYPVGGLASDSGMVYMCNTAHTATSGNAPPGAYWTLITDRPRTNPGIATMGELLFVDGPDTIAPDTDDMQRYGRNTVDDTGVFDLYPMPEEVSALGTVDYANTDGPDEAMGRFQTFLSTYNTRSDLFCAYILVEGYSAGDFTGPLEAKRAIAIFDRSALASGGDSVQIVSVVIFDQ